MSNLNWMILPGKFLDPGKHHGVYEETYSHWRSTWAKILNKNEDLESDIFMRQDMVCPLLVRQKVIGMIACNFFNLNQELISDYSYMRKISPNTLVRGVQKDLFMTIEYLSVLPDYRKSFLGVSLGDVLLGLSMKVFDRSDAVYVLGTARVKNHVDQMCERFGFTSIKKISKFGHPCSVILNTKKTLKEHPDHQVSHLVENIWMRRKDLTENTTNNYLSKEAS